MRVHKFPESRHMCRCLVLLLGMSACSTFLAAQPMYVSFNPEFLSEKKLSIGQVRERATAFTFVNTLSEPVYGVHCTFDKPVEGPEFRSLYRISSLPMGPQTWQLGETDGMRQWFERPIGPG